MKDLIINNLEIAKKQEKLSGEITANRFNRLADFIVNNNVNGIKIDFVLTGSETKFHLPSLHLTINTVLPVICQRCLDEMPLELSLAYDYVLCDVEPQSFDGDEDVDWLEISREMNLSALIEDELLMAIPLAPTHAQECKPSSFESGEKHNPFAALKNFKKKSS